MFSDPQGKLLTLQDTNFLDMTFAYHTISEIKEILLSLFHVVLLQSKLTFLLWKPHFIGVKHTNYYIGC